MNTVVTYALGTALFGTISLWLAGSGLSISAFAVLFIYASLSMMLGQLCLVAWARLGAARGVLPAAFALGFGLLSVALSVFAVLFGMALWLSALICAALVVAAWAIWRAPSPQSAPEEVITLALLAILLLVFLISPISSPDTLKNEGLLPIWADYYVHANTIYSFSSRFLLGQDIAAVGLDRVFYHYGPFMLPALVQAASGISGLAVSTAILLPVGLFTLLMGAAAICIRLGGIWMACAAFFLLVAMPGPEAVGLHAAWFDFNWHLVAAPGNGPACAVAFATMWMCLSRTQNTPYPWRVSILLALSLAAIILLRVQVFLLCAPVAVALFLLTGTEVQRRFALWLAGAGLIALIAVLSLFEPASSLWFDLSKPGEHLDIMLAGTRHYLGWSAEGALPQMAGTLVGRLCLVAFSTLGVWAIIWPVFFVITALRKRLQASDLIVPLALASYIGLILFAPVAGNGDVTEFKQRHFVLLYMIAVLGSTHLIFRQLPTGETIRRILGGLSLIATLALAVMHWGQKFDAPDADTIPWTGDYHAFPFAPGVQEAAAFVAAQAAPGDLFMMGPDRSRNWLGAQPQFISLSGMQAFIGRSDLMQLRDTCVAAVARERQELVEQVDQTANWSEALDILKGIGVRWYIRAPGDTPNWTASGPAVFTGPDIAVYDTQTQAPGSLLAPRC